MKKRYGLLACFLILTMTLSFFAVACDKVGDSQTTDTQSTTVETEAKSTEAPTTAPTETETETETDESETQKSDAEATETEKSDTEATDESNVTETEPQETDETVESDTVSAETCETVESDTEPQETAPLETKPHETEPQETDASTETDTNEADTESDETAAPVDTEADKTETDTESETETDTEADFELSVEEAMALGESMDHNKYTADKYYVTGFVTKAYGNNIVIADEDGNEITVYNAYNADGTVKLKDMAVKPAVGDIVTVYGVVGQSNGSARIKDGFILEFETPEESSETETETETDTQASDDPNNPSNPDGPDAPGGTDSPMYGNGAELLYAGIDWETGFFANVKHDIDESLAVAITASELLAKMQDRDGASSLKDGEVWIVEEQLVLTADTKYYGNGAAIIAKGGILIKDAVDVVLKDVIIKGDIKIENSHEVIFYKIDVVSTGVTVEIDEQSSDVSFKTCRIYGKWNAIKSYADNVTVYRCYVRANHALCFEGDDILIQDCKIFGSEGAVSVLGSDNSVRENTVNVLSSGFGVIVGEGSTNALVALNDIKGAQNSISVCGGYNCSVTLNRAIIITGANNTNLYVIENNVGGYLDLKNNNYLIADANKYPNDGLVHKVVGSNNLNTNGGDVTNLAERAEVGVNEALLPHTNKDLFVGMARKSLVADASFTTPKGLGGYIKDCAKKEAVVVIAPGAYATIGSVAFDAESSNTKVYAYGVYQEYSELNYANFVNKQLDFEGTNNVEVRGLTLGYAIPSSGQVRVVDKYVTPLGDYKLVVIADAGFWDGITKTDPELFNETWLQVNLADENGVAVPYVDENLKKAHTAVKNYDENGEYDGTMTITIHGLVNNKNDASVAYGEVKSASAIYERIEKGTVLTCRLANGNRRSIYILNSNNITLCDLTLYGYTAAFSAYANGVSSNINFIRYNDAVKSSAIIDKQTYDKYVALEKEWGVDFEVYEETLEDGTVRYRGSQPRSSSVDGFHCGNTVQGANFTSCIVESMVDDGMNQHSNPSRLHDIEVEGEYAYIYYKGTVSDSTFNSTPNGGTMVTGACPNFGTPGSIIYIYTPDGREVCRAKTLDTFALADDAHRVKDEDAKITIGSKTCYVYPTVFVVKVSKNDINWDVIGQPDNFKYDLSDNSWNPTNMVIVDNASQSSGNYTVDNMLVRNNGSRGFLIKSWNVTIKHCTFENVSLSGIYINPEVYWGESTMAKDVVIQQCLFNNTGFLYNGVNQKDYACIRIAPTLNGSQTISQSVDENALPIENITITGCKFTNNKQRIAIWVNSAKNVVIENNTFDDNVYDVLPSALGIAVMMETCRNIEISDNTYNYAHYNGDITNVVRVVGLVADVHGSDVETQDGSRIFADKLAK